MSLESFFEKLGSDIQNLFKVHASQIKEGLADAQSATTAAISIATVLGEPPSVAALLTKTSEGLTTISTAVDGETNATTLAQQVSVATGLATALVNNGSIGIKNPSTQSQIAAVVNKINSVANVISASVSSTSGVVTTATTGTVTT